MQRVDRKTLYRSSLTKTILPQLQEHLMPTRHACDVIRNNPNWNSPINLRRGQILKWLSALKLKVDVAHSIFESA